MKPHQRGAFLVRTAENITNDCLWGTPEIAVPYQVLEDRKLSPCEGYLAATEIRGQTFAVEAQPSFGSEDPESGAPAHQSADPGSQFEKREDADQAIISTGIEHASGVVAGPRRCNHENWKALSAVAQSVDMFHGSRSTDRAVAQHQDVRYRGIENSQLVRFRVDYCSQTLQDGPDPYFVIPYA
jgi:hypothetical protein